MTDLANMTKEQLLDLVAVKKDTIKQLEALPIETITTTKLTITSTFNLDEK